MEKLLIIGINTRGLINSAFKLPYQTYSVSYYSTVDFKSPSHEKHLLNQYSGKTCGFFEKEYSPDKLLGLSLEYMEEMDKIILSTGISPNDFKGKFKKYKEKIVGNLETIDIEDKYKFYRKIKNKYLTPKTFKIKCKNSQYITEIIEIAKQHENTSFIIKPIQGSGGYGVSYLKYNTKDDLEANVLEEKYYGYKGQEILVQEYISGTNISSSVLSTKKEAKTLINSRMLTEADFGKKNSFKYCGNIVPLNYSKNGENNFSNIDHGKINEINKISEEIISKFNLIGSNGIDMILDKKSSYDDPYIIEVNSRFQGTYECVEEILGINLLDAHIKACEGKLINIPTPNPNKYSIKRIIYSDKRIKVSNININNNIYDIPFKGAIIEKGEPLLSIITPKNDIQNAEKVVNDSIKKINENIIPI